jgi:hypothetical protein
VKHLNSSPRFDVDFQTRIKQSKEATNAVRMPRLGYALYRVYELNTEKNKLSLNSSYGLRKGPINVVGSPYTMTVSNFRQTSKVSWQQLAWAFIDDIESLSEPAYDVRWLKSKHVTLLQMKGHRVEPAQPGDKITKKNNAYAPVKLSA